MHALWRRLAAWLAVLLMACGGAAAREPHWPQSITIGTASPGGSYFAYGEGLARLLSRELKITVWARPTEGPSENIKLLEKGEVELAFVTLGVAQQAWNGSGDWTSGERYRATRFSSRLRRRSGGQAGRHWTRRRHHRHLHARLLQGPEDRG
jgi:uncharacterized protein